MKTILIFALTLICAFAPISAQAKLKVTEAKLSIARQILDISPASEQLDMALDGLEKRVPANKRAQFRSIIRETVDVDRLSAGALLSMCEIFTEKELEAMLAYQSSAEGQAIQRKLPGYQAELKPLIEAMLREAMVKMQQNNIPFQ